MKRSNFVFGFGCFVLATSPSLMLLVAVDFVGSNHEGYFPDLYEMAWYELTFYAFAAFWQLSAIYVYLVGGEVFFESLSKERK